MSLNLEELNFPDMPFSDYLVKDKILIEKYASALEDYAYWNSIYFKAIYNDYKSKDFTYSGLIAREHKTEDLQNKADKAFQEVLDNFEYILLGLKKYTNQINSSNL